MHKLIVIGAGRIGTAISQLLAASGSYQLTVIDQNPNAFNTLKTLANIDCQPLKCHDRHQLAPLLSTHEALIAACPFYDNLSLAQIALEHGCSYFDLTEDVQTAEQIAQLSQAARPGQVFMPQCGLAPGFIAVLARDIFQRFERVEAMTLRVGALPEFPSNEMMYNLTWSTDGLINEYCNPCHAIRHGELIELLALEGLENFSLDGVEYEAFNTSGGLGTLCDSLYGKIDELSYKTIRYKGHQYLMNFLINGLKLGSRRELLKEIFEHAVAMTLQDVVLITVSATGWINKQFTQLTDSRKIYHQDVLGSHWSAIQIATAAGICTAIDLFCSGKIAGHGFIKQESIQLQDFLDNRFGRYYQDHQTL
jgi:saccharopine dehydrogenase-like NADP-dependent oxidoreductase